MTYQVLPRDLVTILFSGVPEFARKPAVLATGILVALCEWPVMDALRQFLGEDEDSLGIGVCLCHQAPVRVGTTLTITACCASVTGRVSRWNVAPMITRRPSRVDGQNSRWYGPRYFSNDVGSPQPPIPLSRTGATRATPPANTTPKTTRSR
jgi:predicted thioesterase